MNWLFRYCLNDSVDFLIANKKQVNIRVNLVGEIFNSNRK